MNSEAIVTWDDAKMYFDSFGSGPWLEARVPLIEIIAWVKEQRLESELFLRFGLSGLWISDRPHTTFEGHMLHIEPQGQFIRFAYERTQGATDGMVKAVARAEAIETFREFLVYKFGVYRKNNQTSK